MVGLSGGLSLVGCWFVGSLRLVGWLLIGSKMTCFYGYKKGNELER